MSLVPDKLMSHEQQLVLAFLKAKMWNTQSKQCYSKKQEFADFEVVLIFADQLLLIVCVWVFGSVHEVQPCTPSSVFVPGGVISGLNFSAQFSLPLFFQSICLIEKCEVLNGKKGFFFFNRSLFYNKISKLPGTSLRCFLAGSAFKAGTGRWRTDVWYL